MFNRSQAPAKGPSQPSARQPVQPEATPQVASRQPTTLDPLPVQPSSSRLNVRPPGLGSSPQPRSEIPPMPPTSAAHLHQGFVLSVDQSPGEPAVTAIMGSVQPRGANVRASAPRDREPGPLNPQKKVAQFFKDVKDGLGKSISGGLGRLRNRLRRAPSSPTAGSDRTLAVSAPTLVATPEARRFTQQDVLLRVDGAIRGAQLAEKDLGTLNLDSPTLEVSHLATGNGTFRRLATALKTGSQLIENDRDYDVPDGLKDPLQAIADFYKRPEVTRHLIAAGDERGWARDGDGKIDAQTLRGLADEGFELLRLLGEAKDSLALTGPSHHKSNQPAQNLATIIEKLNKTAPGARPITRADIETRDRPIPTYVYRATRATVDEVLSNGIERAGDPPASDDEYLARIIKHSARTGGSGGSVPSLSANLATSSRFLGSNPTMVHIDTSTDSEGFRTMANIILHDAERLIQEGYISAGTVSHAISNLVDENEAELFYVRGDIPPNLISSVNSPKPRS